MSDSEPPQNPVLDEEAQPRSVPLFRMNGCSGVTLVHALDTTLVVDILPDGYTPLDMSSYVANALNPPNGVEFPVKDTDKSAAFMVTLRCEWNDFDLQPLHVYWVAVPVSETPEPGANPTTANYYAFQGGLTGQDLAREFSAAGWRMDANASVDFTATLAQGVPAPGSDVVARVGAVEVRRDGEHIFDAQASGSAPYNLEQNDEHGSQLRFWNEDGERRYVDVELSTIATLGTAISCSYGDPELIELYDMQQCWDPDIDDDIGKPGYHLALIMQDVDLVVTLGAPLRGP